MKIFKLFSLAVFILSGLACPAFADECVNDKDGGEVSDEKPFSNITCTCNEHEFSYRWCGIDIFGTLQCEFVGDECIDPNGVVFCTKSDKDCLDGDGHSIFDRSFYDRVDYTSFVCKCKRSCPSPYVSVADGGTGQKVTTNSQEKFFQEVEENLDAKNQSISGCAYKLLSSANTSGCDNSSNLVISYNPVTKKYDTVDGNIKLKPVQGKYVSFNENKSDFNEDGTNSHLFDYDYCKNDCPNPAVTNPGYESDLWEFEPVVLSGTGLSISSDATSCKLNLSSANSACCFSGCSGNDNKETEVIYKYAKDDERYKRIKTTIALDGFMKIVDDLPAEDDLSHDFCVGSCNNGKCIGNNACVVCPAGHYCPKQNANIQCSEAPMCDPASFSTGGAAECTQCADNYSTINSGPELFTWTSNGGGSEPFDGLCLSRAETQKTTNDEEEYTFGTPKTNAGTLGWGCTSPDACQLISNAKNQLCLYSDCRCTNMNYFKKDENTDKVIEYTEQEIDCVDDDKYDYFILIDDTNCNKDGNLGGCIFYKTKDWESTRRFSTYYKCSAGALKSYNLNRRLKLPLDCGAAKNFDKLNVQSTNQSVVQKLKGAGKTHKYSAN